MTPKETCVLALVGAPLLAEALQELYPGVKFGIGPAIENGFYYDIDPGEHKITAEDFSKIEAKMLELARRKGGYRPQGHFQGRRAQYVRRPRRSLQSANL